MRIVFSFFIFGLLVPAFALADLSSEDSLRPIKQDITQQIIENHRLRADNEALREEYERLKPEHERKMREFRNFAEQEQNKIMMLDHRLSTRDLSKASVEELEADVLLKQTQNQHLKAALLDLEHQERLWKMKAADAEYQRQALELDSAAFENKLEKSTDHYLSRIEELQRRIIKNHMEEKDLLTQYSLVEDEAKIIERQKGIFERENTFLQTEAVEYQSLKDKTGKESEDSLRKAKIQEESFKKDIEGLQQKKQQLESELVVLRAQKQEMDAQLDVMLRDLQGREQVVADIERLKQDNEHLKSVLSGLRDQAQSLP